MISLDDEDPGVVLDWRNEGLLLKFLLVLLFSSKFVVGLYQLPSKAGQGEVKQGNFSIEDTFKVEVQEGVLEPHQDLPKSSIAYSASFQVSAWSRERNVPMNYEDLLPNL